MSEQVRSKIEVTAHDGKDVEQGGCFCINGGRSSLYSHYRNHYDVWVLRKLVIDLPQDPPIPLLSIYPKDIPSHHKDTCSIISQWLYL